jgi:hypothetical protein
MSSVGSVLGRRAAGGVITFGSSVKAKNAARNGAPQ